MAGKLPPLYEPAILRDLRIFQRGRAVKADDGLMLVATRLQKLRLVSVRPVNRREAQVELTETGLAALGLNR